MSINRQQNIIKVNQATVTKFKTNLKKQNQRCEEIQSNAPNKLFSKKETCHSSECENEQGEYYEGHDKENSKNRNNILHQNEKKQHFDKAKECNNADNNSRKAKIPKLEIQNNQFKKVKDEKDSSSQMKYQSGQDEQAIQTERLERLVNKRSSKVMEQKTQRLGKQSKAQMKKHQAKIFVKRYLREHNRQELAEIMTIFESLEKMTESKLKLGVFSLQDSEIDNLIEDIEYFIEGMTEKYAYTAEHQSEMGSQIKKSESQMLAQVSFAEDKKQSASVQTQMDDNGEKWLNKMKEEMEKQMQEYELKLVDIVEAVYHLKQTIQQLDDQNSQQQHQNEKVSSIGDNCEREEDKKKEMSKNIKSWKEELNSILSSINNNKSKYGVNKFGGEDTFKLQKQGYEIMKSPSKNQSKWLNRETSPRHLPTEEYRIKPFSLNESETNKQEEKAMETVKSIYLMFKDVYKFMMELLYFRVYECLKQEKKANKLMDDINGMYKKYANMQLKCQQTGKNAVYALMNSLSAFMGELTGELGSVRQQWKLSTNI